MQTGCRCRKQGNCPRNYGAAGWNRCTPAKTRSMHASGTVCKLLHTEIANQSRRTFGEGVNCQEDRYNPRRINVDVARAGLLIDEGFGKLHA
jgi:hypothetical protein